MSKTRLNSSPNLLLTTVSLNGINIHPALTAKKQEPSFISLFPSSNLSICLFPKFIHFFLPSPLPGQCALQQPSNWFPCFCSCLLRVHFPLSSQCKLDHVTSLLKTLFRIKTRFSTMTYKAFRVLTLACLSILIPHHSLTFSLSPSHCASPNTTTSLLT